MIIDKPASTEPLRQLWKQAFGDPDTFLDSFFDLGFSPNRCRQITVDGTPAAALYWFDCLWNGKKIAYLYAVATDVSFRGNGLCRALMSDTHRHLQALGYSGAILVPGSKDLFRLYERLGYRTCCYLSEFICDAAEPIPLRQTSADEYAALRRAYLPQGGVVQEGPLLAFLGSQVSFYAGKDFLLCAAVDGDTLTVPELLGNISAASGIVAALGAPQGRFRTPGAEKPFAMYYPLTCSQDEPSYFALALD